MKSLDLLNDPPSVNRGEELSELYLEAFSRYLRMLHIPEHMTRTLERGSLINHFITEASKEKMTDEDYRKLGRKVVDISKAYDEKNYYFLEAYAPVSTFLARYDGHPIAAGSRDLEGWDKPITDRGHRRLRQVGGFTAVSIPHVAALGINHTLHAKTPRYEAQIFDNMTKTSVIAISSEK